MDVCLEGVYEECKKHIRNEKMSASLVCSHSWLIM